MLSVAALDPNGGCDTCDPKPPTPPAKATYAAPVAESEALRVADDEAFAAHTAAVAELQKQGVIHRDLAARNVLMAGSARFLHDNAHTLATSHGGGSDEQMLNTLLQTALLLENGLEGLAKDAGGEWGKMLTAQRESVEKERKALAAVLEAGTAPTARHEAAHVVQQHSGVHLRTTIVPTRVWVEAGQTVRLDANCTAETAIQLVDAASAAVVSGGSPRSGSTTLNSQSSSTRTSFAVLLGPAKGGECDLKLTASLDLRAAPKAVTSEAALQAITNARAANAELVTLLADPAYADYAALETLAALGDSSAEEMLFALQNGAPLPLEDAQLAAAAKGALVSAIVTELATFATGDPALQAAAAKIKATHEMQMSSIRNMK